MQDFDMEPLKDYKYQLYVHKYNPIDAQCQTGFFKNEKGEIKHMEFKTYSSLTPKHFYPII